MAALVDIPTNSAQAFQFLCSLSNTCYFLDFVWCCFCCLVFGHINECECILFLATCSVFIFHKYNTLTLRILLQFSSITQSCLTLCDPAARQASLSITTSQSLLKLMFIDSVMPFNHLILCCSLLLQHQGLLQSFPASGSLPVSQFFTSGGQSFEFQLQHQSFSEYSGLISFRMDWLDLFVVQGSLKSSPAPPFKNISSSSLSLFPPSKG